MVLTFQRSGGIFMRDLGCRTFLDLPFGLKLLILDYMGPSQHEIWLFVASSTHADSYDVKYYSRLDPGKIVTILDQLSECVETGDTVEFQGPP